MGVIWNGFLDLIFGAMQIVYGLVGDWGISIIAITILFRLLIWPLMVKQVRSMREMQKIQPLMKEIQKKYADDREKQSQEMMALYKEHNVNPMSGCLPMLAQMPLLMGFFAVIMVPRVQDGIVQPIPIYGMGPLPAYLGYVVGEPYADLTIRTASFLNILPDITLTPSDAWALGPVQAIPYVALLALSGIAILIPILLQQKNMKGPQARQQKMIGYGMAIFMTYIGWGIFSGGVLLYLSTSSLFAAGQQFMVQRGMEKEERTKEAEAEAAKEQKKAERKEKKAKAQAASKKKK